MQKWVVPYVIEPSAGVDRGVLAILNEAYQIEELSEGKSRTVLNLIALVFRHLMLTYCSQSWSEEV